MKGGREHQVPLSERALQILKALPREEGNPYVFIGSQRGAGLSNTSLRSTFKDWASEVTAYPREVTEMALAHAIGDKVEAAYRRGQLLAKRTRLMQEWARYCNSPPKAKNSAVIPIRGSGP
jgi:integrase